MTRRRFGPVTKTINENFLTWVQFANVLPTGEAFVAGSSSASARLKTDDTDATAILLDGSPPTITFVGSIMYARLKANSSGDVGRYIVEFEAVTDGGTLFEAEIEVEVAEREPVGYLSKFTQENFFIGIDFDPELVTPATPPVEALASGFASSKDKFTGADTTATLLAGVAVVTGSNVLADLATDPGGQKGRHVVTIRGTTDGVVVPDGLPNIYEDTFEILVEDSPP